MAVQQRQFERDDQGKPNDRSATALAPARGVGSRAATFIGGDIDPATGNVVPGTKQAVSQGFTVTGSENPAPVEPPPSKLTQVVADNQPPPQTPAPQAQAQVQAPAPIIRNDRSNGIEQVSKWFCYGAGTMIQLAEGSWRAVEDLRIGDDTMLGGLVTATGQALTEAGGVVMYRDLLLSGSHAVFHQGRFQRVGEIEGALHTSLPMIVFPIATENHLLVTQTHLAADFTECAGGYGMTPDQRLEVMNADEVRLARLKAFDVEVFGRAAA